MFHTAPDFTLVKQKENVELGNGKTTTLKHPQFGVALYNVFDSKMHGKVHLFRNGKKQECWLGNTKCNTIDDFENSYVHTWKNEKNKRNNYAQQKN